MALVRTIFDSIKAKSTKPDFWIHVFLYVCLFLTFWPITHWFANNAQEQSRILHACVVLAFASILLVYFSNIEIRQPFSLNTSARLTLFLAYGLTIINFALKHLFENFSDGEYSSLNQHFSLIYIPAYCYAFASLILFVCGEEARRIAKTVSRTLCIFIFLSILMTPLDWPLRGLAGKWSAYAFDTIGKKAEIGMVTLPDAPPMLILLVNEHPFHVASECNGFGVIITSTLLACLLSIYRKSGVLKIAVSMLFGMLMGFLFNLLRIITIVILAPHMMEQYHFMHETVGAITYWGCLVIVWTLMHGPTGHHLTKDAIQK